MCPNTFVHGMKLLKKKKKSAGEMSPTIFRGLLIIFGWPNESIFCSPYESDLVILPLGHYFVLNQVCHHPPISACHAESENFSFWQGDTRRS